MWCNSSAIKHTCVEQQLYVSKALMLCVALLNHSEIEELREGNTHKLLTNFIVRSFSPISCFFLVYYYEFTFYRDAAVHAGRCSVSTRQQY